MLREVLVAAAVLFWVLSLDAVSKPETTTAPWLRRVPLRQLAPLLALLLPIPPAGVLAFTSWETLTDWNHGIPFLLPIMIYWGMLSAMVYLVLWVVRTFMVRATRNAR